LQRQLVAVESRVWQDLTLGKWLVRVKFQPAGHILGSAYIECDLNAADGRRRVVFSGDLGAPYSPLLPAPKSPYRADLPGAC
jgi:metallo-beta-lactamase family protein